MGDLSGFLPQWQQPQWQGLGAPQNPLLGAPQAGPQFAPQLGPPQNAGPMYAPQVGPNVPSAGPQFAPRLGPDQLSGPQFNPGAGLDLTRAVGIPFLPHGQQVSAVAAAHPGAIGPRPLLHPELVALLSQILRRFNSRPQIKHRRPAD